MITTLFKTALVLSAALTLVGCMRQAPMHAAGTAAPDAVVPAKADDEKDKARDEKAASPLVASVSADKATYKAGESVTFSITLRNTSKLWQTLHFRSGQSFDVAVRAQPDGEVLWNYSHGRMFTMALRDLALGPGEQKTWTATWKQVNNKGEQLPRGSYAVTALVTANGGIKAAPITVTLAE